MDGKKLLVVDDQADICEVVCEAAAFDGWETKSACNATDFHALYDDSWDVIIMDLVMPDTDGIELLRSLADQDCQSTIILMSGFDKKVLDTARQLGQAHGLDVAGSLLKPFRIGDLRDLLTRAVRNAEQSQVRDFGTAPELTVPELKAAIENEDLCVHFQPQMSLENCTIHGAEALIRWDHPEHGLIYPDRFIHLAEQAGLMPALTERVLVLSIKACREWREHGFDIHVSVNIPVSLLSDLTLPNRIQELLEAYGVPPAALLLEVTETGLIQEIRSSLDVLTRLRMKGIELSVDDFGTGYSSLQQAGNIPATELKIDKSFVMSMLQRESARAIVDSVIDMGRRLNMRVLAEGIESEDTLHALRKAGCRLGQGYLFSRALPCNRFLDWITSN